MSHYFTANDNTEMVFELIDEAQGCQQFKIIVKGQPTRVIRLTGLDTEVHYKTLEILLAWGMCHFKRLKFWIDSVEPQMDELIQGNHIEG